MTNTPGDGQPPEEPNRDQTGQDQSGYGQPPGAYGQAPYGQAPSGQTPYGQGGYAPQAPMQYAPDHPKATTVLVLGILGLVVCGVIAPFAWSMGKKTLDEIDASQGTLGGRGAANAGYILGIVGTILLGLAVLMFVLFAGIGILGAVASSGSSY
ncbi:MAG TPA: hypothetical protein VFG63_11355 [Nocardioidaceae bacterium]|nr:hypothetical protein [Nocardioidaceae bacterium]